MVEINIDKGTTNLTTCTGHIISNKIIYAPCHCFTDNGRQFYEAWRVNIYAGTGFHWQHPPHTQNLQPRKIFPHPNCTRDIRDNDVAVMILQSQLSMTAMRPKLQPVNLGQDKELSDLIRQNTVCDVRGLEPGIRNHDEAPQKKKVVYKVSLIDAEKCRQTICKLDVGSNWCSKDTFDGYVCALPNTTTCLGHSGAGLFCKGKLYGIDTVDTVPCTSAKWPLIFTSLSVRNELLRAFYANAENNKLLKEARPTPNDKGLIPARKEEKRDPFLVEIDIEKRDEPIIVPLNLNMSTCTGIIIKRRVVLAPCHCFTRVTRGVRWLYESWRVEVIAASGHQWQESPFTQRIKSTGITAHPDCTADPRDNNLAFVKLEKPLEFFTRNGQSIGAARVGREVEVLKNLAKQEAQCHVRGILPGTRGHPSAPPKDILIYGVTLISTEKCRSWMCGLPNGSHSYWCTKGTYEGYVCAMPQDIVCPGHSGAGLFCNGKLFGVDTVDNIPCTKTRRPIIFSNIQIYNELVEEMQKRSYDREIWNEPPPKRKG